MELDREDLNDLFEENENEGAADSSENKGPTEEGSDGVKVAAPKRIVKNPRLKFNPERLCGERGIPVLVDHFKDVKFRGKGYEKEDLDKLLSTLELWTHRLFPSMKFEDCLNQIEKLGKKRPVQTCLRKIRLDMPILNSDFARDDEEEDNVQRNDDEEDNVQRNDDPEPFPEDPFDRLIGESQGLLNSNSSVTENFGGTSFASSSPMSSSSQGQVLGSSFGTTLTEEQKKRMEQNRLLAAERRKAKLEAMKLNTSNAQSADHETSNSQNLSVTNDSIQKMDLSGGVQSNELECEETTLMIDIDHCNSEKTRGSAMELSEENTEQLGLDDLIDLVDEGEMSKKSTVTVGEKEVMSSDIYEENIARESEHSIESSLISIPISDSVENTLEEKGSNSGDINKENIVREDEYSIENSSLATIPISDTIEGKKSHSSDTNEENNVRKNEHSFENSSLSGISISDTVETTSINMPNSVKLRDTPENAKSELMSLESILDLVEE